MPNFKLTDNLKVDLNREAVRLLQIPVAAVSVDFPLTLEQVQTATVPAIAREWITGLQTMKADSVELDAIRYALIEETDEIDHSVVLHITLPRRVMYVWNTQTGGYAAKGAFHRRADNPGLASQMPFDIDTLDEQTRTRFIAWVNTATRQARLAHAAQRLIAEFLNNYCASTAELLARWPALKILFDRQGDPWRSRIRDLPHRALYNWGWSTAPTTALEWAVENEKRRNVIDGLLAGASLMSNSQPTPKVIKTVEASIFTWDGGPV